MEGISRPKVGIGVLIENEEGKFLIGKRKGQPPYYSIPGGHLELGETFEEAAIKETLEETGLLIKNPKVFCVTNNLKTYAQLGIHFISVSLYVKDFTGVLQNLEPDKCEGWMWLSPNEIPEPHFDASAYAIQCYLEKQFYVQ